MTAAPGTIAGYAALYDRPTVIGEPKVGYGFRETIQAGAFNGVLNDPRTYAAYNHDPSLLLARRGAGNLRLFSDARGLRYEVDLPETTLGRDLGWMVARGMVPGSSFAFRVAEDRWTVGPDRMDERTIIRVERLVDVSPVVSPAYEDTATEGALAPLAQAVTGRGLGRGAATALDRRLQDVDRIMRAEAARLPSPAKGSATTVTVRQAGSERRLVAVGALERRLRRRRPGGAPMTPPRRCLRCTAPAAGLGPRCAACTAARPALLARGVRRTPRGRGRPRAHPT